MPNSPVDIFLKWLGDRPDQARVAVAIDGDRFLAEAGTLGKETVTDGRGRAWQMVVFRGDDLSFRLAYRKAQTAKHILIVLARSVDGEKKIDISYIGNGFRLALPTGAYHTWKGTVLEGTPIEPDHFISFNWQDRRTGNDGQLEFALEALRRTSVARAS